MLIPRISVTAWVYCLIDGVEDPTGIHLGFYPNNTFSQFLLLYM